MVKFMSGLSNEDIDRDAVIRFLLSVPLRERVEVVNQVLRQFQTQELAGDGNVMYKNTYLVAELSFSNPQNDSHPEPAEVWALALPAPGGGYISDIVTQDGACHTCGTALNGFCKRSICPACGSIVEMT
jgi:hypothetical protein